MPKLRFDTHFQSDGLPVPAHKKILLAVSGGSDSLALLHLLNDWKKRSDIGQELFVATVDHDLRTESAQEAEFAARVCKELELPHTTLRWERDNDGRSTARDAREARYALLCDHAEHVGAATIALGHTMDDQAETVLMRALRGGSTRGLSGMQTNSHYANASWQVSLFRPLLGVRRQELRDYLSGQDISWIDDPSNQKMEAERVRARFFLSAHSTPVSVENIARLAQLAACSRAWINNEAANFLESHAAVTDSELTAPTYGGFSLRPTQSKNLPAIAEAFAALVMAAGGKPYRPPLGKLERLIASYQTGERRRLAIARCLVTTGKHGARFERETRNKSSIPKNITEPTIWDGRFALKPGETGMKSDPYMAGFERFLPASDFPVRRALLNLSTDST